MSLLTIETKRVSFHFNFGPCSINFFFNYNLELYFIISIFSLILGYSRTLRIHESMQSKTNYNTYNNVNITCKDEITKKKKVQLPNRRKIQGP